MGMTMTQMLANMTGDEVSYRLALDTIRMRERQQAERIAKAKRR